MSQASSAASRAHRRRQRRSSGQSTRARILQPQRRRALFLEHLEERYLLATLTVNDFGDAPDSNPGDSICETGAGNGICSLRAAVMEANANSQHDVIQFQNTGHYPLTLAGISENAAATGDLDIDPDIDRIGNPHRLVIEGPLNKSLQTVIAAAFAPGNGNGSAGGDRVFHVLPMADLTLKNVTVEAGHTQPGD